MKSWLRQIVPQTCDKYSVPVFITSSFCGYLQPSSNSISMCMAKVVSFSLLHISLLLQQPLIVPFVQGRGNVDLIMGLLREKHLFLARCNKRIFNLHFSLQCIIFEIIRSFTFELSNSQKDVRLTLIIQGIPNSLLNLIYYSLIRMTCCY